MLEFPEEARMSFPPLEHEHAHAAYDPETRIATITYRGNLNADASAAAYEWLGNLTREIGTEQLYGEIFDFRQVTEFMPDNLMDARKQSRRFNLKTNVNFPVAMIVKDFYQEEILRGPMQNVKENARKTIVKSVDEALAFMQEWHAQNPAEG